MDTSSKGKVTVVCQGGWTYTGKVLRMKLSPFGALEFIELSTAKGSVKINVSYIMSILEHEKRR